MSQQPIKKVLILTGVFGTLGLVGWTSSLAFQKADEAKSSRSNRPVKVGGSMWSRMDKEIKSEAPNSTGNNNSGNSSSTGRQ
jgi:hypothetical protein